MAAADAYERSQLTGIAALIRISILQQADGAPTGPIPTASHIRR